MKENARSTEASILPLKVSLGSKTCQEKNRREVREQLKLSETHSNSPKLNETIRQFDFRRWNALEKSAPYTVLHGHCLRGSGTY